MGFDYGYQHENTVRRFFIGLASNILNMLFVLGVVIIPILMRM
jgi:hypothetical protein